MIRKLYNYLLVVISKFFNFMMLSYSSEENYLDYYDIHIDDGYSEIKNEVDLILKRDLSFPKEVLEQQERIWLSFVYINKLSYDVKKDILDYVKTAYNLNGWWSKNNVKNSQNYFEYELTIEFFSPQELSEILKRKTEYKYVLEMVHVTEEDEHPYEPIAKTPPTYTPKREEKTWDGEWYKKNKEFKSKKEKFLKSKDEWIHVPKKR